ncbi:MAG: hypothetical protein NT072_12465 [Deltaproteobacteria bacterium]|nr:hypothetical protein [Deltaproteobacteria bacterium]
MIPYVVKLIEVTEEHTKEVAKQWYKDVKKNPRTPTYHTLSEEKALAHAFEFYGNVKKIFLTDTPSETARQYFSKYAEDRYNEGVPVHETIYALTLMRRHMWLYAEFQALFVTPVEHHQAVAGLNRTILIFDYAVFTITEKYQELTRRDIKAKLRTFGVIPTGGPGEKLKMAIVASLVVVAMSITCYYHSILKTDVLFAHLFYVPVVMAAIWYRRWGVLVALILGVFILLSHVIFLKDMPIMDDLIRAVMFLVIGVIIATLTEGLTKAVMLFKSDIG